jgi:sortase A
MRHTIFLWSMRLIFLISLLSVFYCSYQIFYDQKQVDASLKEWEATKPVLVDEAQIPENPIGSLERVKQYSQNAITVKENSPLYFTLPNKGDVFGKISIPKLKQEFPILHGSDQKELAKGVGHFIGSVLPGEPDNTVLAGHRDTVFRKLGQIEMGDLINIETSAGKFTYRITKQRIVDQDDRTVIVPYDHAVLTLVTCYPFDYIGAAPQRYILIGELVTTNM